ncbi:CCC motif membrane protein [Pedobacter sp. UBA4863]|uniref:CCC motif membrane protein n=1 Tax=Pedobacter sp. UBA4863 TaxID=1947060 RepID=UPI0025E2005A|nr:CCC motif membrane protein [Pedobacter sp. UBA4863]
MSAEQVPNNSGSGQQANQPFNQTNQFQQQGAGFGFGGMQQALPNATAVLVLGILSIVTCCCFYGAISLVLAIIALVLAKKDKVLYFANTGFYTESSYKNLNAGRVCAIIGLVFGILIVIALIVFVSVFGFEMLSDQEALKEWVEQMQNQQI